MNGDHLDVDELIVSQVDAIVDTTAKTLALNTFGFGTTTVSGYGEPWWSMREKSAAATNESFWKTRCVTRFEPRDWPTPRRRKRPRLDAGLAAIATGVDPQLGPSLA